MSRITPRLDTVKNEQRAALITFMMAGYPDIGTSQKILDSLPECGVDIIELGVPFTGQAADSTAIRETGRHTAELGQTVDKTLGMVRAFRRKDNATPIVVLLYANILMHYGTEAFCEAAQSAGIDGMVVVDIPVEQCDQLHALTQQYDLDLIQLISHETSPQRAQLILEKASGMVYYASIKGVSHDHERSLEEVEKDVTHLRSLSTVPVITGFGVRTTEQLRILAGFSEGLLIGEAFTEAMTSAHSPEEALTNACEKAKYLSGTIRSVSQQR